MAIDTAFKRRSSAASRRLPWMRRFGIAPDGMIGQADRQAGAWVYAGILPEEPDPDPTAGFIADARPTAFAASPRSTTLVAGARSTVWIAKAPR